MASDAALHDAFSRLQPLCARLTQEQTVEIVSNLNAVVTTLDKRAVSELVEYVLFPLRLTLKKYGAKQVASFFQLSCSQLLQL